MIARRITLHLTYFFMGVLGAILLQSSTACLRQIDIPELVPYANRHLLATSSSPWFSSLNETNVTQSPGSCSASYTSCLASNQTRSFYTGDCNSRWSQPNADHWCGNICCAAESSDCCEVRRPILALGVVGVTVAVSLVLALLARCCPWGDHLYRCMCCDWGCCRSRRPAAQKMNNPSTDLRSVQGSLTILEEAEEEGKVFDPTAENWTVPVANNTRQPDTEETSHAHDGRGPPNVVLTGTDQVEIVLEEDLEI